MALCVFAVLLAAERDHWWRHTAWTTFEVFGGRPEADGVFVERRGGGWDLNPKIAKALKKRLSAEELAALRREAAGPFGGEAAEVGEVGEWVSRVSSVTLIKPTVSYEQRVRVELVDAKLAERVGRMLADEVLQQSSRMRIDAQIAEVERLMREVEALGDQAPPELRAKLREAGMGMTGMHPMPLRRMERPYPVLSRGRELVAWRLGEAALPSALWALVAGAATAGLVAWAGRRRAGRRQCS